MTDAELPDRQIRVSPDLDHELLDLLQRTSFEVCIDAAESPTSIRVSESLAERISTWQTLQKFLSCDNECLI